MDKDYSADTKAHREYMAERAKNAKAAAKGVLNRLR
jgi:hypothetical protein